MLDTLDEEYDIDTTVVEDATDARPLLDDVDCVVCGPHDDPGAMDALESIRETAPELVITLFYEDEATAARALRAGADHCIRYDEDRATAQAEHVAVVLRQELERRRATRTLETETAFVRKSLDALDDVFFVFDLDGEFVHWNEKLTAVTGYSDAEIATMAPTDFIVDGDVDAITDAIGRAVEDGRAKEEATLVTKSGEHIPYEFTGALLEDGGRALGICGIGRDVTHRKRRERELERYGRMVETMGDGMYALDTDGRFTLVNEAFCSMTGYPREDLLGEHVSLVTGDADIENGRAAIKELLGSDDETVLTYEITAHTATGERFPCEIDLTLLFDDTGAFGGSVGVARDVTEQRSREAELERYETIVETAPVGVFVLDEQGRIIGGNDNAWRMGGYDTEELMGEPFLTLVEDGVVSEAAVEEYVETVRELLSAGTETDVGTIEADITPHDGEQRTYLAHISLLPFEETFRGTVGVFQDITERKRRERALEQQAERLGTMNRVNEIIRDVNQALVRASTRAEIEQTVCEHLTGRDAYRFAWIGEQRVTGGGVEPRVYAGTEAGYLDARPDVEERSADHVTAETAIETGEMQVAQSIAANPAFESWREPALERGFESAAAIPLVYRETTYGVLCVYSPRPNAFDDTEREVLRELGETIAYAFSAAERRRALISDTVVELEFALRDRSIFTVDLTARTDCRVTLDGIVERSDGTLVEFVTITGVDAETVSDLAADRDDIDAHLISDHGEESVFQFLSEGSSSTTSLADRGGVIREGTAQDGEGRLVFELPREANVRALVEAVSERYDDSELLAQRERERTSTRGAEFRAALAEALTDRQEEVLKTAYLSGFFEWPRASQGDDVAGSLGISGPTFHEHIRTGQRKLLDAYFESASASDP